MTLKEYRHQHWYERQFDITIRIGYTPTKQAGWGQIKICPQALSSFPGVDPGDIATPIVIIPGTEKLSETFFFQEMMTQAVLVRIARIHCFFKPGDDG
jgi:hypothetical protein